MPSNNEHIAKRSQLDALYTKISNSTPPGISTHNRFDPLGKQKKNSRPVSNTSTPNNTIKPKIPPIIALDISLSAINDIMQLLNIPKANFLIKYMSIGTKISLDSNDHFHRLRQHLKSLNKHFFTHDIHEEKTNKFVLSGLHEINTHEIKQMLSEVNIKCLEVKKMTIKNQYKCLYLVYFDDKNIKLDTLRKIRSLSNIIVNWSHYNSSKNGPTQCNNCQVYGHGNKNCNLPPRCLYCGGKHYKTECSAAENETFVPKCCLCEGNHQSNSVDCPKRSSYIQMRQATSGHYKPLRPEYHSKPFNADPNDFPRLSQPVNDQISWASHFQNQQTVKRLPSRTPNATQPSTSSLVSNDQLPQPSTSKNQHSTNDLFSLDELLLISQTLISELSNCKTRIDQYNTITKLALKFVYGP